MLDLLFTFYRKNITTYRLVFQFMRTWHIFMQVERKGKMGLGA